MYSSHQKEARISETFPCPECGEMVLQYFEEDVVLSDGKIIHKLLHLKCGSCKARFYDDDAIHIIQSERHISPTPV